MSLNFDVGKIENYAENYPDTEEGGWNWITYCVVHRMMHTGLGWALNESNAAEFYARCKFVDKMSGTILIVNGEPSELTPEMIKGHIGLTCNVAPESRWSFVKRYLMYDLNSWKREYDNAVVEA